MRPIQLDRIRNLHFSVNAYRDAEIVTGMGLVAMVHPRNVGFRTVQALLWAGLKHEDPTLTLDSVGILMEEWPRSGKTFDDLEKILVEEIESSGWFRIVARMGEGKNSPGATPTSTSVQ